MTSSDPQTWLTDEAADGPAGWAAQRMGQRDDGAGPIGGHARIQTARPGNSASSVQGSTAGRIGSSNTYG